jgi:hypothetical protein
MASLREHMGAVTAAQIAKRAKAEAAVMSAVVEARGARDAAGLAVETAKERLAGLEGTPLENLPADDVAIGEHLLAVDVAKTRLRITKKKLGDAEAVLAAAEAELEADKVAQTAFDAAQRERERAVEDFDAGFSHHAGALHGLISWAIQVAAQAQAARSRGKSRAGRPAGRALEELLADGAALRIELVDRTGAAIWRGDGSTTASTDTDSR